MIDLHTHILPDMDDGAKTPDESVKMLEDAYAQGVRLCVATPHAVLHRDDAVESFLLRRKESAFVLSKAIKEASVPLPKIFLGAEVFLDHDISKHPSLSALCIADSPYLLVEFPLGAPYNPYWSEWLHSLILRGFSPIVAHIDRYDHAEKMIEDFGGLAVTYQVNAARFRSFYGRRFVSRLLEGHAPVIVSSDMHSMGIRRCDMENAYSKAKKKFPDKAEMLFGSTAEKMMKSYFGGEEYDKNAY